MFTNLLELIKSMPDEAACRKYIAEQRWGAGKVECPYCGHSKAYVIEGGRKYKCASRYCYKKFSVTIGTFMEDTKLPLIKWLTAIYIIASHKKGISSHQLSRDLGITQKNSWFLLHRIRKILTPQYIKQLGTIVEVDEMYVGGSIANKHVSKRKEFALNPNWQSNKTTVLGIIERGGNAMAKVIENEDTGEVERTVRDNVEYATVVVTDSHNFYTKLNDDYYHNRVNHTLNEYVRGNFHTNTVEGMFSHFKRMVYGIYHSISPKHTQQYLNEFIHRYNTRKLKDADRFTLALKNLNGRLTYAALLASPVPRKAPAAPKPINRKFKPVIQRINDEVVGQYNSLVEAERMTGVWAKYISQCIRGKREKAGGFSWDYVFTFEEWQNQQRP